MFLFNRNTSNGELFSNVKYYLHELFQDIGPKFPVMEFVPLMKYYYRSMYMDFKNTMENIMNGIRINLNTHLNVENENHMPDLCDALIQYKNEAIISGKESAQYLNDTNICLIFNDLLGGMFILITPSFYAYRSIFLKFILKGFKYNLYFQLKYV